MRVLRISIEDTKLEGMKFLVVVLLLSYICSIMALWHDKNVSVYLHMHKAGGTKICKFAMDNCLKKRFWDVNKFANCNSHPFGPAFHVHDHSKDNCETTMIESIEFSGCPTFFQESPLRL